MHRSVLQNKKYIKFAEKNSVEVMCIGGAARAVASGHKKAGLYEAKDANGKPVKYMIEFPGFTPEQLDAIASSAGPQKYQSRGIPYTVIVNPHTLEEMASFLGGQSAGTLMDAVAVQKKALNKAYGKSLKRKDLRKFRAAAADVRKDLDTGKLGKALSGAKKLVTANAKKPEALRHEAAKLQSDVVAVVLKRLDEIEATIDRGETKGLKRELSSYVSSARGTDVAKRAKELLEKLKAAEGK